MTRPGSAVPAVDVVVLTALGLEYDAVRAHLGTTRSHVDSAGTRYEIGRHRAGGRRVALALIGPGNLGAATLTGRAVETFAPAAVLLVGVAGGLSDDVAVGDVVVATRVSAYHGGRDETGGFRPRPRGWPLSHGLEQLAREVAQAGDWRASLSGAPAVHFKPIVSGEVVLDSRTSPTATLIAQHYSDAAAIDMESAGVAEAAHRSDFHRAISIRGISDPADGTKKDRDTSGWQPRAAANAAAFAMAVAERVPAAPRPVTPAHPQPHPQLALGRRVIVRGLLAIAAGGFIYAVLSVITLDRAAAWVIVVSLATPAAILVLWWRRSRSSVRISTPDQIDQAHRALAALVLGQWQDEVLIRQLDDPAPLAVRWQLTTLVVMDHADNITGRCGTPSFAGRSDRIADIVRQFRALRRRRLVIIGGPGMGKTTLAVLTLRELLENPEDGEPVPILLPLSGWRPDAEPLHEWLVRQLEQNYPALRAADFGPDAARSLVAQRRILPVLDGLDELPSALRPRVLTALNTSLTETDSVILTCRTAAYRAAVAAPGGDVLTSGAVIAPRPLTADDAAAYLRYCLRPNPGAAWSNLLSALATNSGLPLHRALRSPLALWLVRKVYIDPRADPSELTRLSTVDAVLNHLLDHLVPALITANPPRRGDHPFRPQRRWDPDDAQRWLGFLARHMSAARRRDLAWWHLPHIVRGRLWKEFWRTPRAPGHATFRFRGRLRLLGRHLRWLALVPPIALTVGLVFGAIAAIPNPGALRYPEGGWHAALGLGTALAVVSGIAGLTAVTFIALIRWSTSPLAEDTPLTPQASLRRDLRLNSVRAALCCGVCALAGGLAIGIAEANRAGMEAGVAGAVVGAIIGLVAGLAIGLLLFLVGGTASAAYLAAVTVLAARRRVPRRLMLFLTDAHRLGLLRQAGPVYQFRHAKLQDRFAQLPD